MKRKCLILKHGNEKMKLEAQETIQLVREAMGINIKKTLEVNLDNPLKYELQFV